MRERRVTLARVFSYSIIFFMGIFFLVTVTRFLSSAYWGEAFLIFGLMVVTIIVVFIYPNLQKVITSVPYWWGVSSVLAVSLLITGIAMTRLPRIINGLAPSLTDYVVVFGSGLFTLANIVAVIMTFSAEDPQNGIDDSNI